MTWNPQDFPPMRQEQHYGNRVSPCFADRPPNLWAMLTQAALRNPGAEALVCGSERLNWSDLVTRCEARAKGLAAAGVTPGARVLMLMSYDAEFVVSLFALFRLGAIAVPVSTRSSQPEVAFMAQNSGAFLVLHDAANAAIVPTGWRAIRACDLGRDGLLPDVQPHEDETAVILHTSGTTGRPKGAMLTHLSLIHAAIYYGAAFGLTPADRIVSAVPLSHVTGIAALICTAIQAGATLIVMPAFKAAALLDLAESERMTATIMVPAMYNLCLMQPDFTSRDMALWRVAAYGGAPMPEPTIRALADAIPGLTFANCYGATEVVVAQLLTPPAYALSKSHCVGCALPGTQALIMDADGREQPPGVPGEIWLGGPNVVPGYWNDDAATATAFTGGLWRSGDIGVKDKDGFVQVLDRMKDMINRGGLKIYSAEVESVLTGHPQVIEAAVVARSCAVLGERAHVAINAPNPVEEAELIQWCRARLADYKVPDSFDISANPLPRNANGKIDKKQLREALPPFTPAPAEKPRSGQ